MTEIIAEIGVNHNGRVDFALALIEHAKKAGADIAKFQMFDPSVLCPGDYKKRAMLKGLALTKDELIMCAAECRKVGIEFMCTPMDLESLDWLTRFMWSDLRPRRIKIGSAQAGNVEFVRTCAARGLPLVISNGMMDDAGLLASLAVCPPETTVLYCVSKYPTSQDDVRLSEIGRLRALTGHPVGFSSHCPVRYPAVAAAYAGAVMLEAHLGMPGADGPDAASSLLPAEFARMVQDVRAGE